MIYIIIIDMSSHMICCTVVLETLACLPFSVPFLFLYAFLVLPFLFSSLPFYNISFCLYLDFFLYCISLYIFSLCSFFSVFLIFIILSHRRTYLLEQNQHAIFANHVLEKVLMKVILHHLVLRLICFSGNLYWHSHMYHLHILRAFLVKIGKINCRFYYCLGFVYLVMILIDSCHERNFDELLILYNCVIQSDDTR